MAMAMVFALENRSVRISGGAGVGEMALEVGGGGLGMRPCGLE